MPRVAFDVHTVLPAATVLTMLTDFTARRPALWPTLSPKLYEVYELGPTSADVKEGSSKPVVIWERAHYDWSVPGRVRWTVHASNYCTQGSFVEAEVHDVDDGGATVHVEWNRTGSWPKGQNADRPRRAHSRSRYPAQSLRTRVRSRSQNALGLSAPQPNKSLDANDIKVVP